jgi:N-alpha-acetyltransferase 15/16, NatA auxiliary subunit
MSSSRKSKLAAFLCCQFISIFYFFLNILFNGCFLFSSCVKHFQEIIEDQFDFHSYCMRKMTLCSYVEMLRLEDRIKSHPFFFKAANTAIKIYLRLHDRPLKDDENDKNENLENLTPSELKKLQNKRKKQQIREQQEKERQQQIEQKKRELSKQKAKEDGGDAETVNEDDLQPEKLEKVR